MWLGKRKASDEMNNSSFILIVMINDDEEWERERKREREREGAKNWGDWRELNRYWRLMCKAFTSTNVSGQQIVFYYHLINKQVQVSVHNVNVHVHTEGTHFVE